VTRLIRAELLKVRTTRLWVGLAIGGLGLVALATVAVLVVAGTSEGLQDGIGAITSVDDVQTLVWSGAAMSFFAVVLAATMATGEFRYGTVGSTYLASPSRADVIASKVLAAIPLGAGYGLAGGVLPLLIALLWFAAKGDPLPFGADVPVAVAEVVLQCAYGAALAVCVGAAIRSQLVAILGLLGWTFVVEPLATALVPAIKRLAPFTGVQGAFGAPDPRLFDHLAAGALMVLYVASGAAVAVLLERRRDV
jgi:ABC-type transport system involved in multi-copper enzyme maturation permease subunit